MPAAVRDAVCGALVGHAGMDEDGARAYLRRMEAEGRWWEECWS
jgi:sulfite reductase alpha subunit-like flavoprotein